MNVGILNKTPLIARKKGHYKLLPLLVSARMRISNKYLTMVIKYISWNHIFHDKYFQNPPILMGRNRCWYCNDDVSRVEKNICAGCKQVTLQITFSKVGFVHLVKQRLLFPIFLKKKSRNGDTLGPVEMIVWPEQRCWPSLKWWRTHGYCGPVKSKKIPIIFFKANLSETASRFQKCQS